MTFPGRKGTEEEECTESWIQSPWPSCNGEGGLFCQNIFMKTVSLHLPGQLLQYFTKDGEPALAAPPEDPGSIPPAPSR